MRKHNSKRLIYAQAETPVPLKETNQQWNLKPKKHSTTSSICH